MNGINGMNGASFGNSFGDRVRSLLHGGPPLVGGKRLISRTDAARLCSKLLPRAGVLGIPRAPRGDAGRVSVVLAHVAHDHRAAFGWIEIPLTGELFLTLDESALAASAAPRVRQIIAAAFASFAVKPVPPDPRIWTVGDRRIAQAANGLWTVVGPEGELVASVDMPEDAFQAARAPAPSAARASATTSRASNAADDFVEMERDHAARWIAKQLREHGYEARVHAATIALPLHGFVATMRVGLGGLEFDPSVPALARTVAEAALRRVGLVERLE